MAGLTPEQIDQLEGKGAISPETAGILRAEILSPGDQTTPPKTLNIPPPDFSKMPPSAGGDIGEGFNPIVTGPATVSPEALSHSPAPSQTSTVAAPNIPDLSDPSALIQKGYDEQRSAVSEAALGAAEAQTALVGESVKQAQLIEDARREEERFQQEKQKRLDDGEALYKQALSDLNAQKIDPDRLYANTSTGEKIIAAIGIALGGIASGMSGKPNAALKVIQDAIDRDIDVQKIEVEKKAKAVGVQGSLYNDLVGRLQNEDAARHYMTSLMLEQSKSVLDQYKTQISTSSQKAELGKLYGQIDVAAGEAQQKAKEALEKDPGVQQGIRAGVKTGEIDEANLSKEDRERYVKGLGFAKDKQAADEITKADSAYKEGVKLIDQIINARVKGEGGGKGAEIMSGAFIQNQQRRAASLLLKIKDVAQLGALNEGDYETLYKLVPKDPTAFTRANVPVVGGFFEDPIVAQLKGLKEEFKDKYKNKLSSIIEPTKSATDQSTPLSLTPR